MSKFSATVTLICFLSFSLNSVADTRCRSFQSSSQTSILFDFGSEFFNSLGVWPGHRGRGVRLSAIYQNDDRVVVSPDELRTYPYTAIGRLVYQVSILDENGRSCGNVETGCTASLVSQCHILTARHCRDPASQNIASSPSCPKPSVQIGNVRFRDSLGREHALSNEMLGPSTSRENDWAVARLQTSPSRELGSIGVLTDLARIQRPNAVTLPGYSVDREDGQRLTEDRLAITIPNPDSRLLFYRGANFGGASGGPILASDGEGRTMIVGIVTQAALGSQETPRTAAGNPIFARQTTNPDELGSGVAANSFFEPMVRFIRGNPCN